MWSFSFLSSAAMLWKLLINMKKSGPRKLFCALQSTQEYVWRF